MIEPGLWDMVLRLRSRGISDTCVLRAMELVPRSRFVSEDLRDRAYDEMVLPLPCGQIMLPPLLCAQMLQLLAIEDSHKVLIVGAGSGYLVGTATQLSPRVFAVERYKQLLTLTEANLARAGIGSAILRWGDGRYGWKTQGPFDRILVTAGLKSVPKGLLSQLAPSGRLVAVIGGQLSGHDGEAQHTFLPADVPLIEAGKSEVL